MFWEYQNNKQVKMNEDQKTEVREARRELSTVKHAADATAEELRQEKAKREILQTKSIGLQWVEKQRRVTAEKNAAKSLSEATAAHRYTDFLFFFPSNYHKPKHFNTKQGGNQCHYGRGQPPPR